MLTMIMMAVESQVHDSISASIVTAGNSHFVMGVVDQIVSRYGLLKFLLRLFSIQFSIIMENRKCFS